MAKAGHSHRATVKKDHKPFKSRHATNGQLKNINKGKVDKADLNNKPLRVVSKAERKNLSKQMKIHKIHELKLARSLFDGALGAEKVVVVISLTSDILSARIVDTMLGSIGEQCAVSGVFSARLGRFKSNVKIVLPNQSDLIAVLDAAKVADYVVFGLSAEQEVEKEYGEQILRAVVAQGVASVVGVVPNLVSAHPKKSVQSDVRQSLQSFFSHFFPSEEKLYALENDTEAVNCVRTIAQKFPKGVNWRDSRGYLIADSVAYDNGYVVVEGTVRGVGFNANRLVHIQGQDYQVDKIQKVREGADFAPDNQELLEELNPDDFEMEEPAEEAAEGFRMEGKRYFQQGQEAPRKYKVPEGTLEYQSKWLLDDVLEGESDAEAVDEEMEEEIAVEPTEGEDMFVELSAEEEAQQLKDYRALEKDDREFPDEFELHPTALAKDTFRDYRGVKSLGNCDWDWDEADKEKPSVFGRLLQVNSFSATKNRLNKEAIREAQVVAGTRVRLFVKAPAYVAEGARCSEAPFVVYALLQHEHKMAVANFLFKTWEEYDRPMPSGEQCVVQYGFRRQLVSPVFNQMLNHANNVHKFERFAHQGDECVALVIAPPLFCNAPAIYLRENNGALELAGQGTLLDCDRKRVVAKRVVLTGHPVKIHKRLVTVRYMFFNTEDIDWFAAVPLFTKSGRLGFIKESLGTHGYFKSTFDGRLTAQDVVAMALYRRVWPAVLEPWRL